MATRRGPKVEPHENPIIEKQVFEEPHEKEEITSKNEAQIFGEDVIPPVIGATETELIAEDEFITSEEAKTPHVEFQKDYFLINDGKPMTTSIDVLPEEKSEVDAETDAKIKEAVEEFKKIPDVPIITAPAPPKRKTLAQLTACELNIYHKTGILPLL